MSDSGGADKGTREWRFYLEDMITFSENVRAYTNGMGQADFVANRLVYDATLRNLELIGEAATHVPEEGRKANTDNSVAAHHCHAQPIDARLSGYRRRYCVEHYLRRYSRTAQRIRTTPAGAGQ